MLMWQFLLPTLLATLTPASNGPVLEDVEEFLRRVNEHDVEAAFAMLAPDFEFRDAGRTFSIGREGALPMLEWDAAVRARSRIDVLDEGGVSVEARLIERNAFLTALGIESLSHRVRYVAGDGLIHGIVLLEAGGVMSRVSAALEPVLEWAEHERPEELSAVTAEGSPIYTGESASIWLEILAAAEAAGVIDEGIEP